jgi:hypothetical protein
MVAELVAVGLAVELGSEVAALLELEYEVDKVVVVGKEAVDVVAEA